MVSFRFINIVVIVVIASFLFQNNEVSALTNKGPTFSLAEQAALSQGESSLLGSSCWNNQPLWSGKKNQDENNKGIFYGNKNNEDQSLSKFTPRTKSNQSSFVPKK